MNTMTSSNISGVESLQDIIKRTIDTIGVDYVCKSCGKPYDISEFTTKTHCKECVGSMAIQGIRNNIDHHLWMVGITKRFLPCSFDTYKPQNAAQSEALEFLSKLKNDWAEFVFISSKVCGTGKTHLAVSTIRNMVWHGITDVEFVSSASIFMKIKNTFSEKSAETETDVIRDYCKKRWLVIDDIGVEKSSDWSLQVWYSIIDRRYQEMLPTIFTSNLSVADIAEKIGPRIASRISSGAVFTIDGNDYRKQQRKM